MAQPLLTSTLVAAAKGGSDYAYSRLVRLYQAKLRGFLRRLCKHDDALADDLAQVTFLKVHQQLAKYDGTGSFEGWLFKIGYRVFLDDYRKQQRRAALDEQVAVEDDGIWPRDDLRMDLEAAMACLSPEQSAAITLCFSQGFSHDEAANILEMPLGTVKSHITRGRAKLQETLKVWKQERLVN